METYDENRTQALDSLRDNQPDAAYQVFRSAIEFGYRRMSGVRSRVSAL